MSFFLLFLIVNVFSNDFDNKFLGITFSYPKIWKNISDSNNTNSQLIFTAIKEKSTTDSLFLFVRPSAKDTADYSPTQWTVSNYKADKYYNYNYIKEYNGYRYVFRYKTKVNDKPRSTKTIEDVIKTVEFSTPHSYRYIASCFDKLTTDSATNFMMPYDFFIAPKNYNTNNLPAFATTIYDDINKKNAADHILIAKKFQLQIFCASYRFNVPNVDSAIVAVLCNTLEQKLAKEGIKFSVSNNSPWSQAPEKVYLHKFRIYKEKEAFTHYNFYILKENKADFVRFQLPVSLETSIEQMFYSYIRKNYKL